MFNHHFRELKKEFGKINTHEFRKKIYLKQWVHLIRYGVCFFFYFKSLKFQALKIALLTP
jgi:hypothetical protein